jgi:hypothetical protein
MTRLTMNFDAVVTAAPLDAKASIVRDGSGDLYEVRVPAHVEHYKAPPKAQMPRPEGVEDLTGFSRGRFTAVRYHSPCKDGGKWLVRCTCGDYEIRRAKALRSGDEQDLSCFICLHTDTLRKRGSSTNTRARRRQDEALLDHFAEKKDRLHGV